MIGIKPYEEGNIKVKDHNHINGEHWRSVHLDSNLNLILTKKNTAVFHKLQNYDLYLLFEEPGKHDIKIT